MLSIAGAHEFSSLRLPRLPSDLVVRTRLQKQLSKNHAITVLIAPVGYGKTTLVARWLEDNYGNGVGKETTKICWVNGGKIANPGDAREIVRVANEGTTDPTHEFLLVIDSFDDAADFPWEHGLIELLRERRNLRVIFTGRQHFRPQDWGVLDLDVKTLHGIEMRFTPRESQQLLSSISPDISADEALEIHESVGGWPILVRIAALNDGNHDEVANFLQQDGVRLRESDPVFQFVFDTAHARTFTTKIASFLTSSTEFEEWIPRLVSHGILHRIDDPIEPRYAYLPIVNEVVEPIIGAAQLRKRQRDLAKWCLENSYVADAMHYAIAASDWRLLRNITLKFHGEISGSDELQDMFRKIPPSEVASDPILASVLDILSGPEKRLGKLAEIVDEPDATEEERFSALITRASYARFNGEFDAAARLFEEVEETIKQVELSGPLETFIPMTKLQTALMPLLLDDVPASVAIAQETYRESWHLDLPAGLRNSAGILALACVLADDFNGAQRWLEALDEAPVATGMFHDMVDTCGQAARVLFDLGELKLSQAHETLTKMNSATILDEMWPFIVLAQSDCLLLSGNPVQGLRELEAARVAHAQRLQPGTIAEVIMASHRANLLLAQGEGNRARATLQKVDERHPLIRAVHARIAMLRGDYDHALVVTAMLDDRDRAHARALRELRVIAAICYLKIGEMGRAKRQFQHFIADEGPGKLRALALVDRGLLIELVETLQVGEAELELVQQRVPESVFVERINLATLTPREQLVLGLLQREMTVVEIANELVVSTNTIKSQMRSLYRKLDVNSRTDAVKRGLEYGFIS